MRYELTFDEVIGRLDEHLPGEIYIEIAVNASTLVDLQTTRAELKRPDGEVAVHLNSFTNVQLPRGDFAAAYDIGPDDNGVPRLEIRFGAVKYELGFMDFARRAGLDCESHATRVSVLRFRPDRGNPGGETR